MRLAPLVPFVLLVAVGGFARGQEAALDSALRTLEPQGFSGVVRIDRNGKTLLEKGYGLANRAEKIPFSPSTVVQIGSNTKDFTVVALLQLGERGKLTIRDPLSRFFPDAPQDKRNITLWQVVNHVAGFPIGLGGDFDAVTRTQFVKNAFARPLQFAPGTGEQYSNTGYALLAAVIEQVSGQSYDEYVRDNILKPLGLKNTGYLLPHFDDRRLAHGYRGSEDVGTLVSRPHAGDGPYWNLRGNGGMLSTAGDMLAFYRALFETNKLLKPETRDLRFNPNEPIGLAGSDLISSFLYERLPRRGLEIIIATNSSNMRFAAARQAIGAVLGLPTPDGGPQVATTTRTGPVKAPSPAVASLIRDFVSAINAGDRAGLAKFIGEHFLIEAGTPGPEQRAQRLSGTHENLGAITVSSMNQEDDQTVEVSVVTANSGAATLRVGVVPGSPPRLKQLQVMVGG